MPQFLWRKTGVWDMGTLSHQYSHGTSASARADLWHARPLHLSDVISSQLVGRSVDLICWPISQHCMGGFQQVRTPWPGVARADLWHVRLHLGYGLAVFVAVFSASMAMWGRALTSGMRPPHWVMGLLAPGGFRSFTIHEVDDWMAPPFQ